MSAFVVDPQTINRILSYIRESVQKGEHIGGHSRRLLQEIEFDLLDRDDQTNLGQAMYNMNVNAVSQRYPRDDKDSLPGTYSEEGILDSYEVELVPNVSPAQAYKSLQCWLYQCTEGNVTENKLFQAFEKIAGSLANEIVTSLPEYETAQWG